MFHMQAWGLHAPPSLWDDVDNVLDEFVRRLVPINLRHRLDGFSALRREIALPQSMGGLGIPWVSKQAPIRAAGEWKAKEALASGATRVGEGYRWRSILDGAGSKEQVA